MLSQNKKYIEAYNLLDWHKEGFTGKGIRIAVFDETPFIRENMKSYCSIPFSTSATSPTHATNVASVIHEFAPDAEIFMLELATTNDSKLRNAKWIADPANKIDLISCSYLDIGLETEQYWQIIKNSGLPFFSAIGNANKERKTGERCSPPCFDWTFAIGGVSSATGKKVSYSNYGTALTCMAYADPYVQSDNGNIFSVSGTSFCQPQVAGVIGCVIQALKAHNIKITREYLYEFMNKYSNDIYTSGKDNMSGFGIIRLPNIEIFLEDGDNLEIILTVGSNIAIVDGVEVDMKAQLENINGSILAPVRFIGEHAGFKVTWDNINKKATLKK